MALLLVSIIVPTIFVGGCLYYLMFNIMAEQLGIPESIAYHLLPVVDKINMILLIAVPPATLVIIWWGVVLSHRFAGPMERLERELKAIYESGDYSKRIHLRKSDDVHQIAVAINRILEKAETRHK
jgi:signal transduction histidine kinase